MAAKASGLNNDFRYVIGKDAAMILEARKNMSDREFQNLLKKLLLQLHLLIELKFYLKSDFNEFYRHYDNRKMTTSGQ